MRESSNSEKFLKDFFTRGEEVEDNFVEIFPDL